MADRWLDAVADAPGFTLALAALGRARLEAPDPARRAGIDAAADALLGRPSVRLAVYGSLAPGEVNEGVLAPLEGRWEKGIVRGELHREGWGAAHGFPGLVWSPAAEPVEMRVFRSGDLPDHWERIDAFEGEAYDRILVPVAGLAGGLRVCNIYVIAGSLDAGR